MTLAAVKHIIHSHYEKIICFCCFLILFTNVGLASTSFSVYQPYIVDFPDVGHAGGSVVLAARTFVSLLCMFVVARYYDKLNARWGVLIGCLLTAFGFIVFSVANNLFAFCLGSAFTGAGYGLGGSVASTLLIGRWFKSDVGTAAGIAALGSGVAAIILPPIVVEIIETSVLGFAFGLEALLAAGLGIILFLLLRNDPASMGLSPYVAHPKSKKKLLKQKRQRISFNGTMSASMKTMLYIGLAFVGGVSIVSPGYLGVLMVSEGFTPADAAILIAVCSVALTVSKFVAGYLFDHIGTRWGSLVLFVFLMFGCYGCAITGNNTMAFAIVAASLLGLGLPVGSVGMSVWSIELAPRGDLIKTVRNFQIAYIFGGFFFNFFPGILKDILGSYVISYELLALMSLFSAAIIVGIYTSIIRRSSRGSQ